MRWLFALPVLLSVGCSSPASYLLVVPQFDDQAAVGVPFEVRGIGNKLLGSCESTAQGAGLGVQSGMGGGAGAVDIGCSSDLRVVSARCLEADACTVETVQGAVVLTPVRDGTITVVGVVETVDGEEATEEIAFVVAGDPVLSVTRQDQPPPGGFAPGDPVQFAVSVVTGDGRQVRHAPQKVLVAAAGATEFAPAAIYVDHDYGQYAAPAAETVVIRLGALETELTLPMAE